MVAHSAKENFGFFDISLLSLRMSHYIYIYLVPNIWCMHKILYADVDLYYN